MPIIINRSGKELRIPEFRKVIPYYGKQYEVPMDVFRRYRGMFELVPIELQETVKQQNEIIEALKKKTILIDIFRSSGLDCKQKPFDLPLNYLFLPGWFLHA